MLGLITAAGTGTRFGAVGRRMHKGLLKVGGVTLIERQVRQLRRCGVTPIYCVTGYQGEQVERRLNSSARCLYNPFYRRSGILGSFWEARCPLAGRAFLFTTADHFFRDRVLERCLKTPGEIVIVAQQKRRYNAEDAKVILRGHEVERIAKAMPLEDADGEFGGMMKLGASASRRFFSVLEAIMRSGRLDALVLDVLMELASTHRMPIRYSLCHEGDRIEIDHVPDLIAARRLERPPRRRTHATL